MKGFLNLNVRLDFKNFFTESTFEELSVKAGESPPSFLAFKFHPVHLPLYFLPPGTLGFYRNSHLHILGAEFVALKER